MESSARQTARMNTRALFGHGVTAGLVVGAALNLAFIVTSSRVPDPATGRTAAYIFAPEISGAPSYITNLQLAALGLAFGAVVVCFLVWAGLGLRDWWNAQR
jgi:hypothetical protein